MTTEGLHRRNLRYITIMFIIVITCLIGLIYPTYAQEEKQEVLLLNSYHHNFTWTNHMAGSILDELESAGLDLSVYVEYMDWKNFPNDDNIKGLYNRCKEKYKNKNFDLIVTTDDKALEFALEHRKELFSDAPIVFSGTNEEGEKELIQGDKNLTGVIEHIDLRKTIAMALRINPDMKELYIIHDQTESGISTHAIVENIINSTYDNIKPISMTNKTVDNILAQAKKLEGDSAVLITTFYKDVSGRSIEFEDLSERISQDSKVPVFHMYHMTMGHGNIGGATISAEDQGKKAGQLAVEILSGKKADEIPIVREFPMRIAFDYEQLQRYHIPMKLIPKEAEIINKPFSFFRTYKKLVIIWITILMMLSFLIVVLVLHIREIKCVRNKLREMAYYDDLTQMPNKLKFQEDFKAYRHSGKEKKAGLIFIDADNFKLVNDTLGHSMGDQFIIEIGKRLQELESKFVKVYRMGGDEFLLLVKDITNRKGIKRVASEMMLGFKEGFSIDNMMIHTTVSAGIAVCPDHGITSETLLMRADIAMYKAKDDGKATYVFYDEKMNEELIERADIENNLRTAIQNEELSLNYQPQYDLATSEINGFEALLRWNNEELGFVPPDKFIQIAEDSHTIIPIGQWVLESACRFIKSIHDKGCPNYTMAVNISVLQVMQEDFVDMVIETLRKNDLEPKHLEIEMTETMIIENFTMVVSKLETLRRYGITVALDDFGTGYSSLNYLSRLPIDTLKIDKTFIDTISENEEGRTIVKIIIALGHGMDLAVLAEGVETEEQFIFLQESGCNSMQGYLLSRPLPEEEVLELIK